jgi:signal transduction histidine kinase
VKFLQPVDATGRHPHVTLRAERLPPTTDAGEQVRVSVIDNGPGIAKEDQEKIFDKFYQAQGGHTREQTGTGLGLAIAKELAHILRCEIQLVSDAGRGSMFSLIMPVSIAPPETEVGALESRFRGTLEGGREWTQPTASARNP